MILVIQHPVKINILTANSFQLGSLMCTTNQRQTVWNLENKRAKTTQPNNTPCRTAVTDWRRMQPNLSHTHLEYDCNYAYSKYLYKQTHIFFYCTWWTQLCLLFVTLPACLLACSSKKTWYIIMLKASLYYVAQLCSVYYNSQPSAKFRAKRSCDCLFNHLGGHYGSFSCMSMYTDTHVYMIIMRIILIYNNWFLMPGPGSTFRPQRDVKKKANTGRHAKVQEKVLKRMKRQVTIATFNKWKTQFEQEHKTLSWLHCNDDKLLIPLLWCQACRTHEHLITGLKKFARAWINGSTNQKIRTTLRATSIVQCPFQL